MNNKLSSVSFFCPAYNDEYNLPLLIPKVHKFLLDIADDFEIIIIEDKSPDKTGEVADKLAQELSNIKVIHHNENRGYGGALKSGFNASKKEYVIYTDGDNQYNIDELRQYIHLIKEADVLSAYVKIEGKAVSFRRKIQSLVYNFLVQLLFLTAIKDINCSLKVYRKSALDKIDIKSNSAFIDGEMLVKTKRLGLKIKQFPVTHYERINGLASGSKPKVVLDTILEMLKFRIGML